MVQLIVLDAPPQPDCYGLANSPIGSFLVIWEDSLVVRLHLLPAHTENQVQAFLKDFGFSSSMSRKDKRAQDFIAQVLFPQHQWNGTPKVKVGFYGTDFQHRIMKKMLGIPCGKTKSYRQLHMAARAVGTVCARNPLPFIVPCHRVTAANNLGNYGFGTALKRQLLEWEKR